MLEGKLDKVESGFKILRKSLSFLFYSSRGWSFPVYIN